MERTSRCVQARFPRPPRSAAHTPRRAAAARGWGLSGRAGENTKGAVCCHTAPFALTWIGDWLLGAERYVRAVATRLMLGAACSRGLRHARVFIVDDDVELLVRRQTGTRRDEPAHDDVL